MKLITKCPDCNSALAAHWCNACKIEWYFPEEQELNGLKVGDTVWSDLCCSPYFTILRLIPETYEVVLDHLPPGTQPVHSVYKTEYEWKQAKIKELQKQQQELQEQINRIT